MIYKLSIIAHFQISYDSPMQMDNSSCSIDPRLDNAGTQSLDTDTSKFTRFALPSRPSFCVRLFVSSTTDKIVTPRISRFGLQENKFDIW